MKTAIQSITPEQAGLTLAVLSGPRGSVREDWPCIEYTVQLSNARRAVVWTGEYRLGVGHVKVPSGHRPAWQYGFTEAEEILFQTWLHHPHADFKNKELQADVAAKLAKFQKVTPKLNDVCASLLSDGSAFFDGQRFEDWADDLGYSSDSIKAKETFEACDQIGRDLARGLSRDELAGLREWAGDY